jgi:hypothetical protein
MRNIFFLLLCCSCGVKTVDTDSSSVAIQENDDSTQIGFDENNYESFLKIENYQISEQPDEAEVRVIDSTAVILIRPNEAQLKEMEEKYGEDFYTIADDASFYQAEAMMRVDSVGVKKISVSPEHNYVHLKGTSRNWLLSIRKEGAPEWNVVFFDVNKGPEIVSAIDVTTAKIKEFFSK